MFGFGQAGGRELVKSVDFAADRVPHGMARLIGHPTPSSSPNAKPSPTTPTP